MDSTHTINERLRQFLEEKQMTVVEFSRKSGLSKENLYKWVKGTRPTDPEDYKKLDEFLILESIPDRNNQDKKMENGNAKTDEEDETKSNISIEDSAKSKVNIFISYSAEELGEILKDYIRLVKKEDSEMRSDRRLNIDRSIESHYKIKYINLLAIINSLNSNAITIDQAIKIIELNGDNEWLSIRGAEATEKSMD